MSELVREQLSAFMDGELPHEECALLLKRVATSAELAACWQHWHLIGDTLRGELTDGEVQNLAVRVDNALNAAAPRPQALPPSRPKHWLMRRSATLAAGVAVIGLAGLVGALVSRQVDGGSKVLLPGAANPSAVQQQVDWRTAPQPVRAELSRYLLMHEVYGSAPVMAADPSVRDSATTQAAALATGTDGS